jgi:dUTP pyrophosphatase
MQTIAVKIKLINPNAKPPVYHSAEAAGFDLASPQDHLIPPHAIATIPLGFALDLPSDYWLLIAARSSLYQSGLMLANSIGFGDPDYRGNNDQYQLVLLNYTDQPVTIKKNERLAQGIIIPRYRVHFHIVNQLTAPDRGGIGSTGK